MPEPRRAYFRPRCYRGVVPARYLPLRDALFALRESVCESLLRRPRPPRRTRRRKHPFRLSAPWRKVRAVLRFFGPAVGFGRQSRTKGTRL